MKTRECKGCDGTGGLHVRGCCLNRRSLSLRHLIDVPCAACLGSGSVTEPDSRKDAMVDAETLRRFSDEAWRDSASAGPDLYDTEDHQASNLFLLLDQANLARGGRMKRHINKGRTPLGLIARAASAAFRAVPALKDAR